MKHPKQTFVMLSLLSRETCTWFTQNNFTVSYITKRKYTYCIHVIKLQHFCISPFYILILIQIKLAVFSEIPMTKFDFHILKHKIENEKENESGIKKCTCHY